MNPRSSLAYLLWAGSSTGLLAQSPAALNGGGSGRGDAHAAHQPAPLASSIHGGGPGRGDHSAASLPIPISSSAHAGGLGRGDNQGALVLLPPIATTVALDSLCAGTLVLVQFTPYQPFFPGNVFTAQLSDANGSFSSPVVIGSLAGTSGGSINATLPLLPAAGTAYRIRVVGSSPLVNGADNGLDITITPQPTWYQDADGDGLGDPLVMLNACAQPVGYVANMLDACPLVTGTTGSSCPAPNDCGPAVLSALCQCIPVIPCSGIFGGADGRGDAFVFHAPTPLFSSSTGGGPGRGDATAQQTPVPIPTAAHAGGSGRGDAALALIQFGPSMGLALRVIMEGPYDPSTGLMGDALRGLASFPLTEPYTNLGYAFLGGGAETITPAVLAISGNGAIVDWVVVEMRSASAPSQVIASRAALVQRDGDVVDLDGFSPLGFALPQGHYKVAVLHRNHLGTMTNNPINAGLLTVIDLSSNMTGTFGSQGRKSISGTFPAQALWAGDVIRDQVLRYSGALNDRDPILVRIGGAVPTNTVSGYFPEDVNLDGVVRYSGANNDRDPILVNIGGAVPTNTRPAQLP